MLISDLSRDEIHTVPKYKLIAIKCSKKSHFSTGYLFVDFSY